MGPLRSDGATVGVSEGRIPSIQAAPGVYILSLRVQGISGSATYSQLIVLDGQGTTQDDRDYSIGLPWMIFALTALTAGFLFILTKDHRALFAALLSTAAMIIVVMT